MFFYLLWRNKVFLISFGALCGGTNALLQSHSYPIFFYLICASSTSHPFSLFSFPFFFPRCGILLDKQSWKHAFDINRGGSAASFAPRCAKSLFLRHPTTKCNTYYAKSAPKRCLSVPPNLKQLNSFFAQGAAQTHSFSCNVRCGKLRWAKTRSVSPHNLILSLSTRSRKEVGGG